MGKQAKTSLFWNLAITVLIALFIVIFNCNEVEASSLTPSDNQYFELKATTIKDIPGQGKQAIFELWGYNIDFSRISCEVQV